MKPIFHGLCAVALLGAAPAVASPSSPDRPDDCAKRDGDALLTAGCEALDRFMKTFNAKDPVAWSKTLHFPHVRLAGGKVQVWNTPAEYAQSNDIAELARSGWAASRWDWRALVQRSDDKLHFLVKFTRYGADAKPIGSYQSLYIVTKENGEWGTQARSSYAGIIAHNSAY